MDRKFGLKNLVDPRRGEFAKFVANEKAVVPPSVDYTAVCPKPRDQGPFGVCVAFGNSDVFGYFRAKTTGKTDLVSVRALYSEIKHKFYPGDDEDDGAQVSDGLRILEQNYVLEADMPYDTSNFERCLDPVSPKIEHADFKYKNFVAVSIDAQDFEAALSAHGPIVIGMDWANEFMDPGPDGRLTCGDTTPAGGHCVSIVAYDSNFVNLDGSHGAFKIMNSWGTEWACGGYCYLPYNQIGLISDAFTVAV